MDSRHSCGSDATRDVLRERPGNDFAPDAAADNQVLKVLDGHEGIHGEAEDGISSRSLILHAVCHRAKSGHNLPKGPWGSLLLGF